ncbi:MULTISPECIES: CRTAC1 family protein [unclassified Lentimonas]|uniref:CRTAC1 family protein n=1 Tax=unclassified Lentimonas TaxID=2630993 RepID=UPI0013232538|nr:MULTISPECIES: CRTAC1 family protein [unclassified Lentimonas]CAA6679647.1 Unannotated [Lentimonas sp. CC4]CAA6683586.1 Unannotated [Lentimonas sp. CC6]CAA7077348.1 Unannotated [Lentimonas sp. CC4]CAA7170133.1 Unannotated [Lentimonas sp. CC21]CAA7182476.1 Unannotated [Lentimonas sp. CC8]
MIDSLLPSARKPFTTFCFGALVCFVSADVALADGAPLFTRANSDVIPLEERSRRKWDAPVIADLDQDGHMDVFITEHARKASVFWNNGGTFSEPQDVAFGDTHGAAAGDYDMDGRMELIISPGGGGGKKPSHTKVYHVNRDRTIEQGVVFDHFEPSRGRAVKLFDGDNDGSLDLVLTAFPLKTQKKGANHLYNNVGGGAYEFVSYLPVAKWMGFRSVNTDFNNDSVMDQIFFGGENMVAVAGGEGLTYANVSKQVLGAYANTTFASSIAEIDYDNDGDFDLFITRADHPFAGKTSMDCEHCRFAFFARGKPFQYEDLKIEGDFKLENLQMAYPHFDVFAGSDRRLLDFSDQGDKHGGKDFTLTPDEAKGWPEERSAHGLYIGYMGDALWRIGGHTKSPTAAVIHNVISEPEVTGYVDMPALLLENRDGVFVDVTEQMGISVAEQTTSAVAGDFDNNGWSDLFIVRHGNPASETEQILYLNQDGKSFVRAENHGIVSPELGSTGGGVEVFDYDQDGDVDLIFGNERGRWHLFTNNTVGASENNYLVVKVGRSPSGTATSLGATLTLKAGERTYKRVVGSTSAAFSTSANDHLHVGLGSMETVDEAIVTWTNGEQETVPVDTLNQSIRVGRFTE